MERKTAHDFDQELLVLFDAYVHGALDRRGFLDRAAKYAVGGVTAVMLLEQLSPKFAEAEVVPADDVDALAAALSTAHDDDDTRARLIDAGHRRASTFSWRRTAEGLADAWRLLAGTDG